MITFPSPELSACRSLLAGQSSWSCCLLLSSSLERRRREKEARLSDLVLARFPAGFRGCSLASSSSLLAGEEERLGRQSEGEGRKRKGMRSVRERGGRGE